MAWCVFVRRVKANSYKTGDANMNQILVIGGGLAGCSAALELANNGFDVVLLEKSDCIGGKVRYYGCKATSRCNNCGLCLVGDLWDQVENHQKIRIITGAQLNDLLGSKGSYRAVIRSGDRVEILPGIASIIVSIGFKEFSALSSGSLEYEAAGGVISGYSLEKLISARNKAGLLPEPVSRVAFIQCFGSRDIQEKAIYCSRVCCGYSTRAARVLKQYYPNVKITFFYMDQQWVEEGNYFDALKSEGIEFIRCRPVKIKPGKPGKVVYEKPGTDGIAEEEFDLIVLSEGIHPAQDSEKIAELCMLSVDEHGFLKYTKAGKLTGIYLAGCASGPKRIEEARAEALTAARQLMADL